MLRKILSLTFLLFLVSLSVHAQNHCMGANPEMCTNYTLNPPVVTYADNHPNAKLINVWHNIPSSPALSGLVSGYNSSLTPIHYGWTSAGQVWEYVDFAAPSNQSTWVQHPEMGTAVKQLAIANGKFYALQANGCGGGTYGVYSWNGSAWVVVNGCISNIGGAQDGTIAGTGPDAYLWYSTNGGLNWTKVTNAGSGWKYAVPVNHAVALAVQTSGWIYFVDLSTGALTGTNGQTSLPPAIDSNENAYVIASDSNMYHFGSAGWERMLGTGFIYISTCGQFCTFGITVPGVWMFPDQSMTISENLTGNTTCTPSPCPSSGIVHTGSVTVKFSKASLAGGTVTGPGVAPGNTVSVTANDTTWDPFNCFDIREPMSCMSTPASGQVNCSRVGQIFASSLPNVLPIWWGRAQVTHQKTGASYGCTSTKDGKEWCSYPVVPNCPNPGPYAFTETYARALKEDGDLDWGWISNTLCFGVDYGVGKGYTCLPVALNLGESINPQLYCDTKQDIINQIP